MVINAVAEVSTKIMGSDYVIVSPCKPADSGFITVTIKKHDMARVNSSVNTKTARTSRTPIYEVCTALPTLSTRVKTKALFVSQFSPEASMCHTGNFLQEQPKLSSIVGMRLKNKFNEYASFLSSVTEDEFPLIYNTDV